VTTGSATLTISIDLELAWGVWDKLTVDELGLTETEERPVCAALIDLFDRYEIPATWAMVAALLDANSSVSRPGSRSCWYAPDIVEKLVRAKAPHEIGSHSGRHVYFGSIERSEAQQDLDFAGEVHRAHSLAFKSFVFPRNAVGHLDALAQAGLRTFRGPDVGWASHVHRFGTTIGRAANLADKFLPLAPPSVRAKRCDGLVDIPGSMLLIGRNGLRRFVLPALTRTKLVAGLRHAQRSGGVFHLWFHPSNFYYRREEQLATLAWFLKHAAGEAANGRLDIRTMGSYAVL
jgi:peptidoglycan/xylan/chitin deacetylase (PgdA/CDA1 family)